MNAPLREVGRRIPQKGAEQRVSGGAVYTQDIALPGMLHAAVLRSPHAHALISGLDVTAARAAPGVVAVITAEDFPGKPYYQLGGSYSDRHPLARGKVRFYGEEIAAIAAETLEAAQAALKLIEVTYEILPALLTPEAALAPDALPLHEAANMPGGRNLAIRFTCDYGPVQQAFADAAKVFEDEFSHGVAVPACMETNGTVASFDPASGDLTLWTATQAPFFIRKEVAHVVGLDVERVHLRGVEVGGGFGGKSKICEQEALAAMLAVKAQRPVKLILDRREEFISGKTDHAKRIRLRTAIADDGRILARATSLQIDNGAYTAYAPTYVGAARQRTTCLYRVETAHYDCDLVYTNKVPGGQYRGMGAPQMIWAIETHMDKIAAHLGMDPLEYRLRQANQSGDVTPLGWKISSCGQSDCLNEVARRIGWAEKRQGPREATPGKLRGVGIAAMIHPSGGVIYQEGNYSNTRIQMLADGRFVVHTQTADTGTWQNTTLAQIAAEALGVPSELVSVSHMDTDAAPPDLGSAASRVAFVSGNATKRAGEALRAMVARELGRHWNCNPDDLAFAEGKVRSTADPSRMADIAEVAALCGELNAEARYSTPGERPDPATGIGNYAATYVFGAQAAEVEVDMATGQVRILKIVAAQDVGRALNPVAIEGQLYGGILQGIGMALQEELIFEEGRPVNASFLDYKVPRIGDAPPIELALIETNDPEGPFGAKAGAEPTINASIAAIANAVAHATGMRFYELPLSPDRILPKLQAGRKLALKPWKRPYNLEVATVRKAYPAAVFPVLRKIGTKFANTPKQGVKPEIAAPRDIDGLLAALASPGKRTKLLGGGTDLFVGLRQGIYDTELLVDTARVDALRGIALQDDMLHIGAGNTLASLTDSDLIRRLLPMLAEGVDLIATPQIRRVATVAGDLCQEKRCWFFRSAFPCYKLGGATCPCFAVQGNNRFHSILGAKRCAAPCPADLAPIFTALGAQAVIIGPNGQRKVAMEDFYQWSGLSCLTAGEVLLRFELPLSARSSHAFEKFAMRRSDFAESSVAVRLDWDAGRITGARIALGAVAPLPIRAEATERALLVAGRPDAKQIRAAAELAVQGSLPLRDNAHKTHLLVNLAERAIRTAIEHAP